MSYIIPGSDLTPDQKRDFRKSVIEVSSHIAEAEIALPMGELIIRDLAPEDLSLSSWATPELTKNAEVEWIAADVKSYSCIAIYKCLQLSMIPKVSSLSFWMGGSCVALFELESCYGGLPILQNLTKLLLDPKARQILERLGGKDEEAKPILCSQMEGWFNEPVIYRANTLLRVIVKSRQDAPPDYLVLGGIIIEKRGMTIA